MTTRDRALLVLADGRVFAGRAYAAKGRALGTAEYATLVTGYQEAFTEPANAGKILAMTAPHIGNTGINAADARSAEWTVAGVVVRDPARRASNWRSEGELEPALRAAGVVGIRDIDTRALTRHLRNKGAAGTMAAGIFSGEALPDGAWEGSAALRGELVELVTARKEAR